MRRLGITQRVEVVVSYSERRDCLDQRWSAFARELGYVPLPLPNLSRDEVAGLMDALELDAVVLSGGNTLAAIDPEAPDAAPERDAFEAALIDEAAVRRIPVIGVCRGMQMINAHLGGAARRAEGHVATRHPLEVSPAWRDLVGTPVNSFHGWAIPGDLLAGDLEPIARDQAGHVEAFVATGRRIAGVMWHPERESPFRADDVALFERFLT